MRIAVLVKHVPDSGSDRRLESGRIVRGEDDILNELDENAIEAAVSLVEDAGNGQVVAFSMGPEDAEDSLMRALQMGADKAVLISDDRLAGSDVFATARVLAAAIMAGQADGKFDLVITGMASLDGMTSMFSPALATYLEMPFLGLASELTVTDGRARIVRSADGFTEQLSTPLPAAVSVTDQINDPRYPNFKAIAAARKKPLEQLDLDDLADALESAESSFEIGEVGTEHAGMRVISATQSQRAGGGQVVTDGTGAEKLAQYIKEVLAR